MSYQNHHVILDRLHVGADDHHEVLRCRLEVHQILVWRHLCAQSHRVVEVFHYDFQIFGARHLVVRIEVENGHLVAQILVEIDPHVARNEDGTGQPGVQTLAVTDLLLAQTSDGTEPHVGQNEVYLLIDHLVPQLEHYPSH